jgi:hypothetical protein
MPDPCQEKFERVHKNSVRQKKPFFRGLEADVFTEQGNHYARAAKESRAVVVLQRRQSGALGREDIGAPKQAAHNHHSANGP